MLLFLYVLFMQSASRASGIFVRLHWWVLIRECQTSEMDIRKKINVKFVSHKLTKSNNPECFRATMIRSFTYKGNVSIVFVEKPTNRFCSPPPSAG